MAKFDFRLIQTILLAAVLFVLTGCKPEIITYSKIHNNRDIYPTVSEQCLANDNADKFVDMIDEADNAQSDVVPESVYVDMNATDVEFTIHASGAIVDTRIPDRTADVILRHFEAIESGDVAAFRSTLGGMQDAVDRYHHMSIIVRYFDTVIGVDISTVSHAMSGLGNMYAIYRKVFYDAFPLTPRNTGIVVNTIELTENYISRVTLIDINENELVYYIGVSLDEFKESIISRHFYPNPLRLEC